MPTLASTVYVIDPTTHEAVRFDAGDAAVPAWAQRLILNGAAWVGGVAPYTAPTSLTGLTSQVGPVADRPAASGHAGLRWIDSTTYDETISDGTSWLDVDSDTAEAAARAAADLTKSPALVRTAVKTANYTATANDLVPVNTTSGAVTITLPTAPADRTRVAVKLVIQGGTNAVTVACAGSDVFNRASGSTTLTLSLLAQAVLLDYDLATHIWTIIADDLPLSVLDARFAPITGSTSYVPLLTPTESLTYNADGTIATQTIGGVATSYTYNADGSVATEARGGVTRTFTYNADGTLASVA